MPVQKLDWDDLRYALAIGQHGSLSAAARHLGVNHATVFRRLKAMEEDIGVRLFERHQEGYVPTPAGEEAMRVGAQVAQSVVDLERRIVGQDLRPSGVVRVTTVESLLIEILPPIVGRFRAKHPEIALELVISSAALNLSRREADVAIRATVDPPETLVGRRLATIAAAAYGCPDYLKTAPPLDDLAAHEWIGYDESLSHLKAARWLARLLAERAPAIRVNTVQTLKEMVRAGVGIGVMPCFMGDPAPDLRRLLPPNPDWDSGLWLLTHPDLRHVARIRAVLDHFAEELATLKPLFEGERGRG